MLGAAIHPPACSSTGQSPIAALLSLATGGPSSGKAAPAGLRLLPKLMLAVLATVLIWLLTLGVLRSTAQVGFVQLSMPLADGPASGCSSSRLDSFLLCAMWRFSHPSSFPRAVPLQGFGTGAGMAGCPAQPTWFAAAREEAQLLQAEILRLQVMRAMHGFAGWCPAATGLHRVLNVAHALHSASAQLCRSRQTSLRGWLPANNQQWSETQAHEAWSAAAAATPARASWRLSCLSVCCQVCSAVRGAALPASLCCAAPSWMIAHHY